MNLFKKAAVATVLAAWSITTMAADDAATRLSKLLSQVSSMQSDFTQKTTDSKGNSQSQKGSMVVKRPGMFRWEVKQPSSQMVMTTGQVLWIYDPELMQATRQKLDDQVGNTPALLLSGDPAKLNAAFNISEESAADGEQVFALKPLSKEALFEVLRVRFNGIEITRMQLVDTLGQNTDINFSNIKTNPKISPSVFEFKPPKGVDVIDQM